jgi:serine O-acetyltransferase
MRKDVLDPVRWQQFGRCLLDHRFRLFARLLEMLTFLLYHAVLPSDAMIGPGTRLEHHALGVVLNRATRIGSDCTIGTHVVIGGLGPKTEVGLIKERPGVPVIGDRVVIGSGARLLGPITIGDCRIGANAVVLVTLPAGCTAVGVPARIVSSTSGGN